MASFDGGCDMILASTVALGTNVNVETGKITTGLRKDYAMATWGED